MKIIFERPEKEDKPKKKMKTLNRVLLCLGIFLAAFIISMVVTFWVKGSIPDKLVECVLGAGLFEALITAGITIVKIFKGKKEETEETEVISDETDME